MWQWWTAPFCTLLNVIVVTYPDWPHRQCVGLVLRRSHVRSSLSAVSLVIYSPARIAVCNTWSSGGAVDPLWVCGTVDPLWVCGTVDGRSNWLVAPPTLHRAVQPVDWIYRLWRRCPSWLWLTATRGSPLSYLSELLQVVDNWTHSLW